MSLGVIIKSPSGIVLAADSRVTLNATNVASGQQFPVHFDNATKLIRFSQPHNYVGAVTFGMAVIPKEGRTAESYLPEFEASLPPKRMGVGDFAERMSDFFMAQWKASLPYTGSDMVFYVAGYDDVSSPYGRVYLFALPSKPKPTEQHVDSFGVSWGGQTRIVDRLYRGFDKELPQRLKADLALTQAKQKLLDDILAGQQLVVPVAVMALQDCVTLAITLVRTTIAMQQLAVDLRGVGGPIDVVTITRIQGLKIVQFKEVTGDG